MQRLAGPCPRALGLSVRREIAAVKVNGYVLVLAAGVLWGTIGLFVNGLAALDVGPAGVSALRMGAGAMVMLPVMLALGVRDHGDPLALLRLNPRQALVCAVMGVFCLSLSNTLYYVAMGAVGMSTASVLLYTSPVFACLLGRLFLGESVTRPKLAALALNVGGCVLAVTNGALDTLAYLRENAAFSMSSWSQEKAAAYRDLLTHDDWEAWIAPR